MFKKHIQSVLRSEFTRFVLAGGFAAAANYLSRPVFGLFMSFAPSIVAAYCIGMLTAYLLYKYCVFNAAIPSYSDLGKQISRFVLVNGFAIVQVLLISLFLEKFALQFVSDLFLRQEIAHFVGLLLPIISSYYGHKYMTFK